jgi:hypothetical protein
VGDTRDKFERASPVLRTIIDVDVPPSAPGAPPAFDPVAFQADLVLMSYLEDLIAATQHPDPTQQRFETPPLVDALAEWNQQGNILHPTVAVAVTHCNAILSQASMMWSPPPASLPTAVCDAVLWITQPMDIPKAPPLQQSASSSSWLDRGCHFLQQPLSRYCHVVVGLPPLSLLVVVVIFVV